MMAVVVMNILDQICVGNFDVLENPQSSFLSSSRPYIDLIHTAA